MTSNGPRSRRAAGTDRDAAAPAPAAPNPPTADDIVCSRCGERFGFFRYDEFNRPYHGRCPQVAGRYHVPGNPEFTPGIYRDDDSLPAITREAAAPHTLTGDEALALGSPPRITVDPPEMDPQKTQR